MWLTYILNYLEVLINVTYLEVLLNYLEVLISVTKLILLTCSRSSFSQLIISCVLFPLMCYYKQLIRHKCWPLIVEPLSLCSFLSLNINILVSYSMLAFLSIGTLFLWSEGMFLNAKFHSYYFHLSCGCCVNFICVFKFCI